MSVSFLCLCAELRFKHLFIVTPIVKHTEKEGKGEKLSLKSTFLQKEQI